MNNETITRTRYFDKQFLRTQDFVNEQHYHISMRYRHNIAHHTWGIVDGLELLPKDDALFVMPGIAIDGFGRELILSQRRPLPLDAFKQEQSDELDVWLIYTQTLHDSAPTGYVANIKGNSDTFYRWQENVLIRLTKHDDLVDPRKPLSVPEADHNFQAYKTPPDSITREWPIYLGKIICNPPDADRPFGVDPVKRPYTGLVGESIVDPAGRTRVTMTPEYFAVFGANTSTATQLKINNQGQIDIHGGADLQGNLTMVQGAIEFQAGKGYTPPKDQFPWRIYRTSNQENDLLRHELRIEMAGGSQGENQVVIGSWSPDDKAFKPSLTIGDDNNVTVHGNLVVQGQIRHQLQKATPSVDLVAANFSQAARLSGIGGGSALLERVYFPGGELPELREALRSPEGRQAVADIISTKVRLFQLVLAEPTGQRSIVSGAASHWSAFAIEIMKDDKGRPAVIIELLNSDTYITELINTLVPTAKWDDFADTILANEDGRPQIIRGITQTSDYRKELIGQVTSSQWTGFANELLADGDGRTAIILELLNAHSQALVDTVTIEQWDAFADKIVANSDGQKAIIESLEETGVDLIFLVKKLLETPNGQTIIVDAVEPEQWSDFAVKVLADGEGQPAIFNKILGNNVYSTAFVLFWSTHEELANFAAILAGNSVVRNAALRAILAAANNEVVTIIANDLPNQLIQTLIGMLIDDDDTAEEILLNELLDTPERITTTTNVLAAHTQLTTFLTALVDHLTIGSEIAQILLTRPNGQQAVIDTVPEDEWNNFAERLLDDSAAQTAVISEVLIGENKDALARNLANKSVAEIELFTDEMMEHKSTRDAAASSVVNAGDGMDGLAHSLNDGTSAQRQDRARRLAEAIRDIDPTLELRDLLVTELNKS